MSANKPWEQKPTGRRQPETLERRQVLIVCEDEKSSCDYFKAFNIDSKRAHVETVGTGMNTDSLVEYAIQLKTKASQPYNGIWCVFDRDDFKPANYDRAFQLARNNGIKVAWANEAFEMWYLLHYNYFDTGIRRHDYKDKLEDRIHQTYDKADTHMYELVKPHQETALRNARRLEKKWIDEGKRNPERENPSTSIHKLVDFLNELAELGSAD
jgi:hypothetical protein